MLPLQSIPSVYSVLLPRRTAFSQHLKKKNTTLHNLKPRDFIFSERPRRKISLELPRKGPSRDRGCCLVSSRDSFTVPQTVAHQAPPSLGFLSQEYGIISIIIIFIQF